MTPTPTPIRAAILVRVSTDKQCCDRQLFELQVAADSRNWEVVTVIQETITGSARNRKSLERLLELAGAGAIDKVMVHEVSRLSRRPSVIHTFVEKLEEAKVSLYWHAQSVETLLPDGRRNPMAAILLALLGEMARSETDVLKERIKSGIANARNKGVRLGRPKGQKTKAQLLAAHPDIVRHLRAGLSLVNVGKLTGKSPTTVLKIKKLL